MSATQLTLEQAIQNIDTTLGTVQADRQTHIVLQQSLDLIRFNLQQGKEARETLATLEAENQRLRDKLKALSVEIPAITLKDEEVKPLINGEPS